MEVKRDVDKNIEQRHTKWCNFHRASGGKMIVVCDNRSCMRNIRSEINYSLGNRSLVVSLTNLADLQAGKREEGDNVWLEARNSGLYRIQGMTDRTNYLVAGVGLTLTRLCSG